MFIIILYIIGVLVGCILLYYIIKAAVRNGIIEARTHAELRSTPKRNATVGKPVTPEQIKLQSRYDNGEITFEFYQSEWNRLST